VATEIGAAAAAVWEFLRCNGPVTADWMYRAVGLPGDVTNRGIGWLAREGRLTLEKRGRKREVRVAKTAEAIWEVLRSFGPMSAERLVKLAGLPEDICNQGIGWLAREGRAAVEATGNRHRIPLGEAAGRVWRFVHAAGAVPKKELRSATGLGENVADQAIGWLVREGKLVVEDRRGERGVSAEEVIGAIPMTVRSDWPTLKSRLYRALGLSKGPVWWKTGGPASGGRLSLEKRGEGQEVQIGEAAGKVWGALHSNGNMTRKEICMETRLPKDPANQGIGWLAREDKLVIGIDRKGHEWFRLNEHRGSEGPVGYPGKECAGDRGS